MTTPKGFTRTETGLECERCGVTYARDERLDLRIVEYIDPYEPRRMSEAWFSDAMNPCLYCGENAVGRVFKALGADPLRARGEGGEV